MDPEECVDNAPLNEWGNVPVPQLREQIEDVVTVILQKRIS